MTRLFDEHDINRVKYLNGYWNFLIDSDNVGKENGYFKQISTSEKLSVLGIWNTEIGLIGYEATARKVSDVQGASDRIQPAQNVVFQDQRALPQVRKRKK